jgi:lipopolysaccharide biosynthesis protein
LHQQSRLGNDGVGQLNKAKIQRELRRAARHLPDLCAEALRKIYFRRWYDSVTAKAIRRATGNVAMAREIAIYHIFPRDGVLGSHLSALAQMVNAGVSPIVVSNLPLSQADKDRLVPLCAQIVERPNVGYDFGGYRDVILGLDAGLERLYLLNDSAWLLPQPVDWFSAARALDVDFAGATSAYCYGDIAQWRAIRWDAGQDKRSFHYGSYALAIGARPLQDPAFMQFWRNLEIRNDKKRTIQRGEIGLTQWMLRHGYRHAATCPVDQLDQQLAALDGAAIDDIAQDLIVFDDPRLVTLQTQVLATDATSPQGQSDRIALILLLAARQGAAYALAKYLIKQRGLQFLKKSSARHFVQSAQITQNIAQDFQAADSSIAKEASQIAAR